MTTTDSGKHCRGANCSNCAAGQRASTTCQDRLRLLKMQVQWSLQVKARRDFVRLRLPVRIGETAGHVTVEARSEQHAQSRAQRGERGDLGVKPCQSIESAGFQCQSVFRPTRGAEIGLPTVDERQGSFRPSSPNFAVARRDTAAVFFGAQVLPLLTLSAKSLLRAYPPDFAGWSKGGADPFEWAGGQSTTSA